MPEDRGKANLGKLIALLIFVAVGVVYMSERSRAQQQAAMAQKTGGFDNRIDRNAQQMLEQGRQIFRFDTFGDEVYWTDTLKLHRAIEGQKLGGIGPGVSPKTALSVGLKVDMDVLPADLVEKVKKGEVDLDDPATTLEPYVGRATADSKRQIRRSPTTLTPTQFVNQLLANAGVMPGPNDLATAVAEFGAAMNSTDVAARSRALRDVAENSTLNAQEFNGAFVLMEYFGYWRRNPNDAPDTDYTGYDFWLTKLNQFNGNFINAEMVKAFISSSEYRQRFGP